MALLVEARAGALDWDRILGEAEASRVARFCFLTLELARIICRAPVPEKARRRLRDAAPPAIVRWLERHAETAPLAMDLYARDRALIYSLHWAMASGWGERAEVLLHSLEAPWREAAQARRYGAFARRMGARLRHLAGRVGRGR